MSKKCIICGKEAKYKIKDSNEFYCEECAVENFGDLAMLIKVEEEAIKLKKIIKERLEEDEEL